MSYQDPIADLLTRIRNAQKARMKGFSMPSSKMKVAILEVLKNEGYIADFEVSDEDGKKVLYILLKYYRNEPVIEFIKRVSKPSLHHYASSKALPKVLGGLGVVVMSTSQGVMTAKEAATRGIGGKVICSVY